MPRLQAASLQSMTTNPIGPGILVANLTEFSLGGVMAALQGDTSMGRKLGALGSAPGFSIARDVTDRTDGIAGLNAPFKGAQVLNRTDATMTADIVELTHQNIAMIHPGLTQADWLSSTVARLTVGTGNSAFSVAAKTPGVTGNSVNIVVSTPAGATTSVSVATNTITVAPASGATANDVVDAINANAQAKALVRAGRPATSDGTGTVAAATSTPLAGGTAGAKVGRQFTPTGFYSTTEYMDNLTFVLEGPNSAVEQIWVLFNALQTDDLDYTPDDSGGIATISCTFTGHVTDVNFDPNTGAYLPPYKLYNMDPSAIV